MMSSPRDVLHSVHTGNSQTKAGGKKSTIILHNAHKSLDIKDCQSIESTDDLLIGRSLTITTPQATMINGSHLDGLNFFRRRLLGNSKTQ